MHYGIFLKSLSLTLIALHSTKMHKRFYNQFLEENNETKMVVRDRQGKIIKEFKINQNE